MHADGKGHAGRVVDADSIALKTAEPDPWNLFRGYLTAMIGLGEGLAPRRAPLLSRPEPRPTDGVHLKLTFRDGTCRPSPHLSSRDQAANGRPTTATRLPILIGNPYSDRPLGLMAE